MALTPVRSDEDCRDHGRNLAGDSGAAGYRGRSDSAEDASGFAEDGAVSPIGGAAARRGRR